LGCYFRLAGLLLDDYSLFYSEPKMGLLTSFIRIETQTTQKR
jgi:hypothetical protein